MIGNISIGDHRHNVLMSSDIPAGKVLFVEGLNVLKTEGVPLVIFADALLFLLFTDVVDFDVEMKDFKPLSGDLFTVV